MENNGTDSLIIATAPDPFVEMKKRSSLIGWKIKCPNKKNLIDYQRLLVGNSQNK